MDRLAISDTVAGIHSEDILLKESFLDLSSRFASLPGTVVLMSGGGMDCARYHILGVKPWISFKGRHGAMSLSLENQEISFKADPFDTLGKIIETFKIDYGEDLGPIAAGLMGYLAYDLKDSIETLPRTSVDDLSLPHICLFAPSIILVHDIPGNRTRLHLIERVKEGKSNLERDLKYFRQMISSDLPPDKGFHLDSEKFQSDFSRPAYMAAVEKIRDYIASGDVYQVNMSQRFETGFEGDPFSLFKCLFQMNPAPFFAFINGGDHQIVSTSPERFLLRNGTHVEARPIKGTRPRGRNAQEDESLRKELLESKKDDAELSMIVDLLRNDIGKVCCSGSVRVAEHRRLEAYENVYHLVSVVTGKVDGRDSVDLIRAAFPGGSITGCPKIRSMEIIDELEPLRRHVYTGSIGYISFHETMDLSIAIRTATVVNDRIFFSVGGGIVYDSDPALEYDETLHKGKTIMDASGKRRKEAAPEGLAWINGAIRRLNEPSISLTDLGFQYGFGFFETVRVNRGVPRYLKEHMGRFNRAWEELFRTEVPDLTWDEIVRQVIDRNGLQDRVAALKIIASRGSRERPPSDHFLAVTARPYTHRLQGKKKGGLRLALFPEPRQSPLAAHKTLNYLYYFLAGGWARDRGADEALILNPDGTVSETNSSNILCIKGRTIVNPVSPHVLPGVMRNAVCDCFRDWGYEIKDRPLLPEDLFSCDAVLLTNSLMGAVPALSLDERPLNRLDDLYEKINAEVL